MNQNEPIQPTQPTTPVQPKSIPWLWIIFGVVILAAAGFFVWNNAQKSKVVTPTLTTEITPSTAPSATPTTTPSISTANWKTYTNPTDGFSVKYPANWENTVNKSNIMNQVAYFLKPGLNGSSSDDVLDFYYYDSCQVPHF